MNSERGANLTRRQRECLQLVSAGFTSKEIARKLSISPSTVDNHLREATLRLGKRSRIQAARTFIKSARAELPDGRLDDDFRTGTVSLIRVADFGSFAVFICK
jgi:DNA-binding CsgD family transcriptional regulator